jgi:hypothetical protein
MIEIRLEGRCPNSGNTLSEKGSVRLTVQYIPGSGRCVQYSIMNQWDSSGVPVGPEQAPAC